MATLITARGQYWRARIRKEAVSGSQPDVLTAWLEARSVGVAAEEKRSIDAGAASGAIIRSAHRGRPVR